MEIAGVSKYFIAIVPPSPITEEIHQLKEYCKEKFNTKGALNSPPHITLHMPFQWKEAKEEKLLAALDLWIAEPASFEIMLNGFSCFEPRVIFINVEENERLMDFQKKLERFCRTKLNLLNADYNGLPFHPHVTIAFRDLKKAAFGKAWGEFEEKNFNAHFQLTSIALLKRNARQWNVLREFNLTH
jgi:2'-5' RNA ligase